MSVLAPPREMGFEGNMAENWKKFRQRFEIYLIAADKDESYSQKVKTNLLLHCIGERALEIYNTFEFDEEGQEVQLEIVLEKFAEYFEPRKNIIYERYRFFICTQTNETIDQFVTELKKRSQSCEFGDLATQLIRDRIVCGIKDDTVRQRLLRVQDLTLEEAINICRAAEVMRAQMQAMSTTEEAQVLELSKQKGAHQKKRTQFRDNQRQKVNPVEERNLQKGNFHCGKCGRQHATRACPAYGKMCLNCRGLNHFANMCRLGQHKKFGERKAVQELNATEEPDDLFLGALFIESVKEIDLNKDWTEPVYIGTRRIDCKLDTGAQTNVLPERIWQSLGQKQPLRPAQVRLTAYGGMQIDTKGTVTLPCTIRNVITQVTFLVVNVDAEPILGQPDCIRLGLVKKVYQVDTLKKPTWILQKYTDVFGGVGTLPGAYKISLKSNVKPVIQATRRVPFKIRDRLKQEIDRMTELGVIAPVNGPTEWVHPLVIVEKPNGQLRLCLDPQQLNTYINREHYQMPTLQEVATRLSGAQVFSVLDANSGYWQVPLAEESANMCVFGTEFGRYKFLRLPFGLNSAPEVFQKMMMDNFGDLEGVFIYIDDILVWGLSVQQHDERLCKLLDRVRSVGLKLNEAKCKWRMQEVSFLGHVLTPEGLKIDPKKTEAVSKMAPPHSRKELERLLGMFTYLSKFVPNFSDQTSALRELLPANVHWEWTEKQQDAFDHLKLLLVSPPVLRYFDPAIPVILSVDSSLQGLGAVLIQENQPVAYASRALTAAEKGYASIERELLAVVFAVEHFRQYVYGQEVKIINDHKPLVSIIRKSLTVASPRLQRLLLRLQPYSFKFEYSPGKTLHLADALSRNVPEMDMWSPEMIKAVHTLDLQVEAQMNCSVNSLAMSTQRLAEFRDLSATDINLKELKKYICQGWPKHKKLLSEEVRVYWAMQEELTVDGSLVFRGQRIIVPKALQPEILKRLHQGHVGIQATLQRAKESVYWTHIRKDIYQMVSTCARCQEHANAQRKEPLISQDISNVPWYKVAADLFQYDGHDYLIIVDYFSKFMEMARVENLTASCIINHTKSIFARHGIPVIMVTDNGPQFSCLEFKNFMKDWECEHITSSPLYPQSNGFVERTIQTVKKLLKKNNDPYLALLEWRNTANLQLGASPAQMLMGRQLRTRIPCTMQTLQPKIPDLKKLAGKQKNAQFRSENFYNRSAKFLSPLKPGDMVRLRKGKNWIPGIVIQCCAEPRSYLVKTAQGVYRRNRRMVKKTAERFIFLEEDENDLCKSRQINPGIVNPNSVSPREREDEREPERQTEIPFSVKCTRSGRPIVKPLRFKDYV